MSTSQAQTLARLKPLARTLVAVDFDGTLAPIVLRPEDARALPGTAEVLTALAGRVLKVTVVTGRPAEDAVEFGGLADVPGVVVLGHYGLERWEGGHLSQQAGDVSGGDLAAARRHATSLAAARPGVTVEEKGSSVALHTRNASDPARALAELIPLATAAAESAGMQVTPGRFVVEIRPRGVDKGTALRALVAETQASGVLFAGDDVGDLPAVAALRELEALGVAGVVVCSDAPEADPSLRAQADLIVPGPEGIQAVLRTLTAA